MKRSVFGLALCAIIAGSAFAQDYDDIYYNPNKKSTPAKNNKKSSSNYIANFSDMDVDTYNNRGFYYESQVDTIGSSAENAEDFIYTQQIQKYYNPTIVVDNANVLADVLNNSYGNVNITIENGYPVFNSIYTGSYYWGPGYYYNWNVVPSWSWAYAWGPFSVSWNWGPAWSWGWGPSWTWGPSWNWGPSWSWGWRPGWNPRPWGPGYAYNPGPFRPVVPRPGWAGNFRPGINHNRPPMGMPGINRPSANKPATPNHRPPTVNTRPSTGNQRPNGNINQGNQRPNGNINQGNQRPNGNMNQGNQRPNGNFNTGNSRPNGNFNSGGSRPGGNMNQGNRRPSLTSDASKPAIGVQNNNLVINTQHSGSTVKNSGSSNRTSGSTVKNSTPSNRTSNSSVRSSSSSNHRSSGSTVRSSSGSSRASGATRSSGSSRGGAGSRGGRR